MALGSTEPWRVTDVEMIPSEKIPDRIEVPITVDYQAGSKFACPEYGGSCNIYDSKRKDWRHLNFSNTVAVSMPVLRVSSASSTRSGWRAFPGQ